MSTVLPTTADAIVASLLAHGVDTVFGIPGVQTYELFDAIARTGGRIRLIAPRHEQAAGYMAYGYARSTGRVGVFSVVPGPGVLNAAAAICTGYGSSVPMLCLTGQVPAAFIGSGMGHLHELPDQLATLRSLTKWAGRIEHTSDAPTLMAEAFRQATSGRPRPVAIEVPWDVFGTRAPAPPAFVAAPIASPAPEPSAIAKAVQLLHGAARPMIMVGSGAYGASQPVRVLAEHLQAPVVSFRGGKGVLAADHPLSFTCGEGFELWSDTDVVVGIGSRMELQWFRWPDQRGGLKVINIDIDPMQAVRLKSDVAIVADAAIGGEALFTALAADSPPRPDRTQELQQLKLRMAAQFRTVQPYLGYLDAIRAALPRDGFFVEESCQIGFASYYGLASYEPRTFVSGGHQGNLGFGFPSALGVKVGNPHRAVVSVTGDGGFQFGLQELITAANYAINLVTVVFDNGAYGNVRRDQNRLYDGRMIGSELVNPDFVAIAEASHVRARMVASPAELGVALTEALSIAAPSLLVVQLDDREASTPWPYLMPRSRR